VWAHIGERKEVEFIGILWNLGRHFIPPMGKPCGLKYEDMGGELCK